MLIPKSARGRAILSGTVLVLLLAGMAAVAVWRARADEQALESLDRTSSAATALEGAQGQFWLAQAALSALVISGDPAWVDDYDSGLAVAHQNLAEARAAFQAMGETDRVAALDGLTLRLDQFNDMVRPLFPVIMESDRGAVIDLANSSMAGLTKTNTAIIADLEEMAREAQREAAAGRDAADQEAGLTLWLLLGLSAGALVTGIGAVVILVGSVVRPLAALRTSARAIASGDLEARAKLIGPEEVASLARDFNEMTGALSVKTRALEESEKRYRLLAENASDIIWTMDMNLRLTYESPSVVRIRGYSPEEAMTQTMEETLTPASIEVAAKALAEELAIEQAEDKDLSRSRTLELEHTCKDGSTVWLEVTTNFLRDEDGRPVGILGVSRDISERKRAEEVLRESEARYKALLAGAPVGMIVVDLQTRQFRYANPGACRMFGYTEEEFLRIGVADLSPKEFLDHVLAEFEAQLRGEKLLSLDIPCLRKDGTVFYADIRGIAMVLDGCKCSVGIFTDITERKRAAEALRESEERFRRLGDATTEGIAIHDQGTILDANQALGAMLGYDVSEIIGRHGFEFIAPECRDLIWQNILSESEEPYEALCLRKDGSVFPVELRGKAMPYKGSMARVTAIRDVTERKRAEQELRRRNQELALFLDLSNTLASSVDVDSLVETALASASKMLPQADIVSVGIYDKDRDALEIRSARGKDRKVRLKMAFKPGEATSGKVFETGKSILCTSPEELAVARADLSPANLRLLGQATPDDMLLQSAICSPLVTEGRVLGSMFVATSKAGSPFQLTDLALLEAAASHIAVALDKAQLHGETKVRAITDGLTGLYNRAHFYERLPQETERSSRYNHGFAVAMMDVDHFKQYNDTRGHQEGDKMLRLVADSIRSGLRRSDLAFRYGGDEFAAILLQADAARARAVMDRINRHLAKNLKQLSDAAAGELTLSAGIACFAEDGSSPDELVRAADIALYNAKWAMRARHLRSEELVIESLEAPPGIRAGGMLSTTGSALAVTLRDLGVPEALAQLNLRNIAALGALAEIKDPYVHEHQERTSDWAASLAEQMGLSPDRVRGTKLAGLLHDLGKVGVSKRILRKPGKLTEEEFAEVKEHSPLGSMMIVSQVEALQALVPIVRHHHERFDGNGYPDGLVADEIPLEARILAVVDAFDAMTHERSYHEALSREEALAEVQRCAGTQFDPAVVEAFLAWEATQDQLLECRGQAASEHEQPARVATTRT
jgi:diguanylate cyclase (GGDEF)-like protein/PAS domain S-box-containing protein